ncbi:MAG: hypothetical protein AAGC77_00425 [Pseudomonadota bacterium]
MLRRILYVFWTVAAIMFFATNLRPVFFQFHEWLDSFRSSTGIEIASWDRLVPVVGEIRTRPRGFGLFVFKGAETSTYVMTFHDVPGEGDEIPALWPKPQFVAIAHREGREGSVEVLSRCWRNITNISVTTKRLPDQPVSIFDRRTLIVAVEPVLVAERELLIFAFIDSDTNDDGYLDCDDKMRVGTFDFATERLTATEPLISDGYVRFRAVDDQRVFILPGAANDTALSYIDVTSGDVFPVISDALKANIKTELNLK